MSYSEENGEVVLRNEIVLQTEARIATLLRTLCDANPEWSGKELMIAVEKSIEERECPTSCSPPAGMEKGGV